jgi:putative transposase
MESSKKSVKYSTKEKMNILLEAEKNGVKVTLEKYNLFPATFYYWKRKYNTYGEQGLDHKTQSDQLKRMKALEVENQRLKILLAEKELESSIKDELIKKKYPEMKKLK